MLRFITLVSVIFKFELKTNSTPVFNDIKKG